MRNDYNLSSQRFMTELNSPKTHIYISTRLSRMLKQRVRKRNLDGSIKGKVKQFISTNRRCPGRATFIL